MKTEYEYYNGKLHKKMGINKDGRLVLRDPDTGEYIEVPNKPDNFGELYRKLSG